MSEKNGKVRRFLQQWRKTAKKKKKIKRRKVVEEEESTMREEEESIESVEVTLWIKKNLAESNKRLPTELLEMEKIIRQEEPLEKKK